MQLVARLTASAALLLALCVAFGAGAIASAESPSVIALTQGRNAVTWAGSEPYAIAALQGTPVTQVHRWDPATQEWLTHIIGQDDPTLPERHLLPRLQYLLVADADWELAIPDPLVDVDPSGEPRMLPRQGAPLDFDAVWPNEYSPLDDLVVLRGADQYLSVRARISGGSGDISVWWVIDGRLNHKGLASDRVSLTPGGHDRGIVYAADESGQVAVAELPRVVRLPDLELPEMTFGIVDHIGWPDYQPYVAPGALEAAAESIADASLSIIRSNIGVSAPLDPERIDEVVPLVDVMRQRISPFLRRGIMISAIIGTAEIAVTSMDLDLMTQEYRKNRQDSDWSTWGSATIPPWSTAAVDPNVAQVIARYTARHLPEIKFYEPLHEPNHTGYNAAIDPWASAREIKASALGLWYENPGAIILGPETGCASRIWDQGIDDHGYGDTSCGEGVLSESFLQAMYDAGFALYHDITAFTHHHATVPEMILAVDLHREVMIRNGDEGKPLWVGEAGWSTPEGGISYAEQAVFLIGHMEALDEHPGVSGYIIFLFQNQGIPDPWASEHHFGIVEQGFVNGEWRYKPAYWAIREYLTDQPPPSGE